MYLWNSFNSSVVVSLVQGVLLWIFSASNKIKPSFSSRKAIFPIFLTCFAWKLPKCVSFISCVVSFIALVKYNVLISCNLRKFLGYLPDKKSFLASFYCVIEGKMNEVLKSDISHILCDHDLFIDSLQC